MSLLLLYVYAEPPTVPLPFGGGPFAEPEVIDDLLWVWAIYDDAEDY